MLTYYLSLSLFFACLLFFSLSGINWLLKINVVVLQHWLKIITYLIGSLLGILLFVVEPYFVPTNSMEPQIKKESYILIFKPLLGITLAWETLPEKIISLKWGKPLRDEIYGFYPPNSNTPYIKRVIGLPGDTLVYGINYLSVNGKEENRNNLPYTVSPDNDAFVLNIIHPSCKKLENNYISCIIPENMYFMLGDNRGHSNDSRSWGFVPLDNIMGKLIVTFKT